MPGDLHVLYNWDPYRGATNVRGIGTGQASYQERVRRTLVKFVGPGGRIRLPPQSRGPAGSTPRDPRPVRNPRDPVP